MQFKERALNKIMDLQKDLNNDFSLLKKYLEKNEKYDDLYHVCEIYMTAISSLTNSINCVNYSK